ncbi:hypothetical protein LTR08_005880 [Meristemomyces frigidus]|nr:hypothetical protein LTR08_005880 [Meristemomyces frigidus]
MRTSAALYALCSILTSGLAAPSDDMRQLRTACVSAANVLNASLNGTMTLNTSMIIQEVVWQIGASTANLNGNSTSPSPEATTNSTNSTLYLDSTYLPYADSLGTLSEACTRRGSIFHQEQNLPVYNTLQSLAIAVHAYGQRLAAAKLISLHSTIRTITAGSDIVNAESFWANNVNYPGRRREPNDE